MDDIRRPVVVIGHRMGQGQRTAKGIEEAGGTAIVIEGMLADMKLGEVMQEKNADLGLSFCGSGGAGAINAANKYGYKYVQHRDSPTKFATAIKEGYTVIGATFMDSEELGRTVVEAWKEKNG